MQRHECNRQNYLFINYSLKFYFLVKIRVLHILASSVIELDNTLPYLMDVRRDSSWATHGVSAEAYALKMCTRVGWAWLDSLIVVVNCCH
jgi:hypothetical protein